jgi:bacillithiol system protein YtxJ
MDRGLKRLRAVHELDQALAESNKRPLLLFKHSHSCGISHDALDEINAHLEDGATGHLAVAHYAIVTVQTHREVSNAISARLGLRHETPQAILVVNGRAVWSASHFRVTAAEIRKAFVHVNEPAS